MTDENTTIPENLHAEEQLVEPENKLPEVRYEDLTPRLLAATQRIGWTKLMPVQAKAMPYIMADRDLMVQSRTGSGKTGAFIMPIIEKINHLENKVQALVLVPTRELARQVATEAHILAGDDGMKVVEVYGGVGYRKQLNAFKEGVHLVVGTPGRVLDHLLRKALTLQHLRVLVFDEADRMLSMGFYPDMRRVQEYLPDDYYACMFSATFPPRVRSLARQFLDEPDFLSLSRDVIHVPETEHVYYAVPPMEKDRVLVRIIELLNPDSAIIFCNTRQRVHYVNVVLRRFGYNADELSSDLSQGQRETVMQQVRDGKLRFLVATDVAARGIDIPELSHVIQYEIPDDPEIYIHRAGRTGRAGETGEAITLIGEFTERVQLNRIAKRYGIDFQERETPTEEDVAAVVAERATVLLEAQLRERDNIKEERMARFLPLVQQLAADEDGRSLLAMLVDDLYQQTQHNPPADPIPARKPDRRKGRRRRRR